MKKARARPRAPGEECILVLQGGGALGAYQAGVFEALAAMDADARLGRRHLDRRDQRRADRRQPAGAPGRAPARVLGRRLVVSVRAVAAAARRWRRRRARAFNETSATIAMLFGVAGLLLAARAGRAVPAARHAGGDQLLRHRAAARDARAAGRLRPAQLGRGAALGRRGQRARRGNFVLLRHQRAAHRRRATSWRAARCRRAFRRSRSTASSTGTAAWSRTRRCSTCSTSRARGRGWCSRSTCSRPAARCRRTWPRSSEREKDIRYSSRTRLNTTDELQRQATLQAARRLLAQAAAAPARRPRRAGARRAARARPRSTVVHLIYRSKHYESQSKDYEFSRASMLEHWAAGMADTQTTLEDPRWLGRERRDHGRARVRPDVGRRRDPPRPSPPAPPDREIPHHEQPAARTRSPSSPAPRAASARKSPPSTRAKAPRSRSPT